MTAPVVFTSCPNCSSEVYDNRQKVAVGWKGPLFKCKDKECGWVKWPPKGQAKTKPVAGGDRTPKWTWETLYRTYSRCWKLAEKVVVDSSKRTKVGFTNADIHGMAATVFIAASQGGIKENASPPEQPMEEPPEALEETGDDLPF